MSNKTIETPATDAGEAPVRAVTPGADLVASDELIRTSPSEMVMTVDQIAGDVKDGSYVAASLIHGRVGLTPVGLMSPLTIARVGTAIQDADGGRGTLLGTYLVCGIAGNLVLLRLMSDRACTVFDWCLGHEDRSGDTVRHSAEPVTLLTFDGDDSNNRAQVQTTRFIENDEDRVAVFIEYDLELTHPELLTLANELEAAAAKIRALA